MGDSESILTSVKSMLGLMEDDTTFDADVLFHINSAIATLTQIGVGPTKGFTVTSKADTYEDFIGDETIPKQFTPLYIYYKTRLGFDPPSSSSTLECMKEALKETEWRLQIWAENQEESDT